MAIFVPGLRDKHNRPKNNGKREVVAHLSLTAMVDMFTVLVVFLLQNYNTQAIQIQQKVELPEAQAIKKLQPANVVVIGDREILVNDKKVEILSLFRIKRHGSLNHSMPIYRFYLVKVNRV